MTSDHACEHCGMLDSVEIEVDGAGDVVTEDIRCSECGKAPSPETEDRLVEAARDAAGTFYADWANYRGGDV